VLFSHQRRAVHARRRTTLRSFCGTLSSPPTSIGKIPYQ
jgi:hypothetical protein